MARRATNKADRVEAFILENCAMSKKGFRKMMGSAVELQKIRQWK